MKKLLLITILLFVIQSYAQKTLEIYNLSNYTVMLGNIVTSTSGAYPMFDSNIGGQIAIPPSGSYILQTTHPTRFPFDSPTSVPYIGSWNRRPNSTTMTSMPSNAAMIFGTPQVFDNIVFRVLDPPGASGGTVGVATPLVTSTNWVGIYDISTSTTTPPTIIYTVVIDDI